MILDKISEFLYPKIFINIIASKDSSIVFVEAYSKNKLVSSDEESFDTSTINTKMIEYIENYTCQTPYFYTSILDKSIDQGIIPTCKDIKKYVNSTSITSICENKKYAYYTSQYALKELKNEYKTIGLDFIFSPFTILNKFFGDKTDNNLAIFLLIENDAISLSVFNNAKLLFAQRLDMKEETISDSLSIDDDNEDIDISLDLEDVNLDDIEVEDTNDLDGFGDIEDLDIGLDIEEFSEEEDIDDNFDDINEEISADDFNEDYQRFIIIQDSINAFYKDDKYESEFIEDIYIADGIGISTDLKKYLEEEMFLNVVVRKIDIAQELSDIAKAELL